jgi:polyisoprenoid-binding protein YceI
MKSHLLIGLLLATTGTALAEPVTYVIDSSHTHPSLETDHFGGLSVWRGLFKKTTGTITMDKSASTGTVDVTIDAASIEFGDAKLNAHTIGPEILDTAKYPTATYKGTLGGFKNGAPTTVTGELTLHGVTKPVVLKIDAFKCMVNPMSKKDVCGADAQGTFNRADFGVNYGQQFGFKQEVLLRIQVEAIKQ